MPFLTVLMGYPASGKSTMARKMQREGGVVRVNRDDIRSMAGISYDPVVEEGVREAEMALARAALKAGYDVVVDDTNLTPAARAMWARFADAFNGGQVNWVFLETPLAECISRDARRQAVGSSDDGVGQDVILKMRDNWRQTKVWYEDRYGVRA